MALLELTNDRPYHTTWPDYRPVLDKITAFFKALSNECRYIFEKIGHALCGEEREYLYDPDGESRGLVVLIHGLNGDPRIWQHQYTGLSNQGYVVRAPVVAQRGNCPIEEAIDPILEEIQAYATENPDHPICLLGVSNGGRIALSIEHALRERHQNPIKVSIVAGAVLGTKKMNLLARLGLGRCFLHEAVVQDLTYQSEDCTRRIQHVREELQNNIVRSFDFYASTEDSQISPFCASLPILNHGETHTVVSGVNHNSIVSHVAEQQIAACLTWMQTYS